MLHLSILLHTFASVNIIYNLNGLIMKKLFVTICAAFAMLVMVSCGGNPAIKAGEAFIADPTEETYKAYNDAIISLRSSLSVCLPDKAINVSICPRVERYGLDNPDPNRKFI